MRLSVEVPAQLELQAPVIIVTTICSVRNDRNAAPTYMTYVVMAYIVMHRIVMAYVVMHAPAKASFYCITFWTVMRPRPFGSPGPLSPLHALANTPAPTGSDDQKSKAKKK